MRLLSVTIFLFLPFFAIAQQGTIRGTVIDGNNGAPIIGANIFIPELSTGTATDLDGTFDLQVEANANYNLQISYTGFKTINITDVSVKKDKVTLLDNIQISEDDFDLDEVVVTATAIRTSEASLLLVKKKSPIILDGISSSKIQLTGDATAVEAAKRVTGVSIEDGKYVYVRGLGDRYSKTTLNGVDIPGLDPDRNTLQMDIFPTNLVNNITVAKNFSAEMPADFTGGLLDIETKDFPEEKILNVSVSTSFNPDMHFNDDYLTYDGGGTDFLGFDDGTRSLPGRARQDNIPTPISGASQDEVNKFISSFNTELGAERNRSFMDFSAGIALGNQVNLKKGKFAASNNAPKLGYIFSLTYRNETRFYDDISFGEYQRLIDPEIYQLRYASVTNGEVGERNVLIGLLGGLAYKTMYSKVRLTAMRLQNGESRAGQFALDDNGEAVGHSGYLGASDNLEYNQRSLNNILLQGSHVRNKSDWEIEWRLSPTLSKSDDPDIRKTAFTFSNIDTSFVAGAAGNPSRIWRSLKEWNAIGKLDISKNYSLKSRDAKLKFGAGHVYKKRDYEILFFDMQFFGGQSWSNPSAEIVLNPENIFPNKPNSIYYNSGNSNPNPNEYSSNVNNTSFYVSNEFPLLPGLKTILGVRAENYVQRHTGRDQKFASSDIENGSNLDNEKVLESLDFFPSANFIYSLNNEQNLRFSYSKTIARPSFKELSFAQILDPINNRIFNGSLFTYSDWDGKITESRISNIDLRWELFLKGGQLFSVSAFYKSFDKPIELVRIPEQQTSAEFQPRNVGDGELYGVEVEFRKDLNFLSPSLNNFNISANITVVESTINMSDTEFNTRMNFEKAGEEIGRTRQMAGQAPYMVNAGLTYNNPDLGLDAGLFYNMKGSTLYLVGVGLSPDVYVEPFHSLNFSIAKKIGKNRNTSIDFKISNLLGDKIEQVYKSFEARDQVFESYSPGQSFGLGISQRF